MSAAAKKKSTLRIFGVAALALLVPVLLLLGNANRLLKLELERRLGSGFSVGEISLGLRGVEADAVALSANGAPVFEADKLVVRADLLGFLKKSYSVSSVSLEKPRLHLEIDEKGRLVNPLSDISGAKSESSSGPAKPVEIGGISISGGEILYLDRKAATPPLLIRVESLELKYADFSFPPADMKSSYSMSAAIPGKSSTASLKVEGKTNPKTSDTDAAVKLKGLELLLVKPYFQKKGDAEITGGTIDIDMSISVKNSRLRAPGRVVLKNLAFASKGGFRDLFLGVPRSLVMKLLESKNGEIDLNFVLEGSLSDPRFSLTDGFSKKLGAGLAEKLGVGVTDAGKAVVELGAKGAKETEKGIENLGKGIKSLFGK